jgi:hypothetical protein
VLLSIDRLLPVGRIDSCFGEENGVGGGYVRTDLGGRNDRQLSSSGVQSLKLQGGAGRPASIRLPARSDARGEKLGVPLGIAAARACSTNATLQ